MSMPKEGQFGQSSTLLGGEPDRNRRKLWRFVNGNFRDLATFNAGMKEWTTEQQNLLNVATEALNKLDDLEGRD
jgi:hypothetical protein